LIPAAESEKVFQKEETAAEKPGKRRVLAAAGWRGKRRGAADRSEGRAGALVRSSNAGRSLGDPCVQLCRNGDGGEMIATGQLGMSEYETAAQRGGDFYKDEGDRG